MAQITSFKIKNYKGIESASITLKRRGVRVPVVMLLGLNECGKTTVLEAISNFVTRDSDLDGVFAPKGLTKNYEEMIPLKWVSNFNGTISITASIELDDEDIRGIIEKGESLGVKISKESISREFKVSQEFEFEDSILNKNQNTWEIVLKKEEGKRKKSLVPIKPIPAGNEGVDVWRNIVRYIRERIPKVAYFPTFIVDMPDRIYLRPISGEPISASYYRSVIQQVFDAEGSHIDVRRHILDRIEEFKKQNGGRFDGQKFASSTQSKQINQAIKRFSNSLSSEIVGSWKRIFNRPLNASSIEVSWDVDTQNGDTPFISIMIGDGNQSYKVSDRSIGFRWFFSFLLFTKFKQKIDDNIVFLLDEPASNLHARAQSELLSAFSQVAESNQIIFSTHSHHMVNPEWLSGAYIIENKAIDFESEKEDIGQFSRSTDIKAVRYPIFAAQSGPRSTYFQPVLDRLQYIAPKIVGVGPYLLLEGITDFYLFDTALKRGRYKGAVIPGSGAGSLSPLISMMIGHGYKFRILMDDDEAGRRNASKYRRSFMLADEQISTVADLNVEWKGSSLESILDEETIKDMKRISGEEELSKKAISSLLSEMYSKGSIENVISNILFEHVEKAFLGLFERTE